MALSKIKRSSLTFGRELGEGGFSTVYQATWKQSFWRRQEVAAKRVLKFQPSESEIMAKLDHPNIVKLLAVVKESPDYFLILKLCPGGSLRSYLNQRQVKKLPFDQFCDLAKQAALPLQYLKEMGIVHKDVKSPNYLITNGHVLKLTDFGIAKELESTMSNATQSASCPWMAPELMRDLMLSPSYDIHSYGVVVWELLTLEVPFQGLEPQVVVMRVCGDNERPSIPSDCPKPIADLLKKCWDADWKKRPSIEHVLSVITDLPVAAKAARQQQLVNGPWQLEREIGRTHYKPGKLRWPLGIAVNKQGDTCVADGYAGKIQVYNHQGVHKLSIDTQGLEPETMSCPREVKIGSDGSFYVTDESRFIKVYGPGGVFRKRWPAVSPKGISSDAEYTCLRGLAMDAEGLLLVGEVKKTYISKHRQDSSHVASIKVDIGPYSLAVTSQDAIIVSDWEESVHIVDSKGRTLHIIKPPSYVSSLSPTGIACFEDIICISRFENQRVHCYSAIGEYLRDIPINIPDKLMCIAFTADGKQLRVVVVIDTDTRISGYVAVYTLQM